MSSLLRSIRQFLSELKHRNVYRVALAYLAAGFVVVELADIAAGTFDLPGWFGPMVWVVVGLGFPIALVLAWALEVTPEGVRVEEPEGSGEMSRSPDGFSFTSNGVIVGLLVFVAGLLLYPTVFSSQEETQGQASAPDTVQIDERSIAVLPFEALSSGEKSETFARGVHDDLLTRLSNISDLTVTSRTSVEQYRNRKLPLPAIADSLGVRWVMEGGVLESGGQIQVNAQLIDPKSDAHVWADDYQRTLTAENLFAIQGEITREIADALKAELTAGEQSRVTGAPTENLQAYQLYVKGRSQLDTRSEEGMRRAVDYFQQALREDSTFALAWSGLSDASALIPSYGSDTLNVPQPGQEESARRALKLDPDLAEAHASMGYFHFEQQNAPSALRHLKQAVDLKPSYVQARHWLGLLQLTIGRPKEGLRHVRQAVELSPYHFAANGVLTWAYLANRQPEKALDQARKVRRMKPSPRLSLEEILALRELGRLEGSREVIERVLTKADSTVQDWLQFELAVTEVAAGDQSRARKLLTSSEPEASTSFGRGLLHAALGQTDKAFEAFREGELDGGSMHGFRYWYPDVLGPLREDPRYEELIHAINEQWGLNPDGSIPRETDSQTGSQADA